MDINADLDAGEQCGLMWARWCDRGALSRVAALDPMDLISDPRATVTFAVAFSGRPGASFMDCQEWFRRIAGAFGLEEDGRPTRHHIAGFVRGARSAL